MKNGWRKWLVKPGWRARQQPAIAEAVPHRQDMTLLASLVLLLLLVALTIVWRRSQRQAAPQCTTKPSTHRRLRVTYSSPAKRPWQDGLGRQSATPQLPPVDSHDESLPAAPECLPVAATRRTFQEAVTTMAPEMGTGPGSSPQSSLFTHTTPPSTAHDDRLSVPACLAEHASNLSALRALVSVDPHYNPSLHDDLWLLRFLLSHLRKANGVAAAARAARTTLAWRADNGMDALNEELQRTVVLEHPNFAVPHRSHLLTTLIASSLLRFIA